MRKERPQIMPDRFPQGKALRELRGCATHSTKSVRGTNSEPMFLG